MYIAFPADEKVKARLCVNRSIYSFKEAKFKFRLRREKVACLKRSHSINMMDLEEKECSHFIVFPSERLVVRQKRVFCKKMLSLSIETL